MKVVLLHDWLTGFRGGERVLEAFCELFPDAPIYTLVHKKGSTSKLLESKEIITSSLNKLPNIYENYRNYLPIMPLAAERLKIQHKADIVLSSSHCVIKGVLKPEGSKHVSYVHSPMRYMYDQFENYFGNSKLPVKLAAKSIRPYLQYWDRRSNENVDYFIANSRFVQKRVEIFYNRSCDVIHPFVDLKDFKNLANNEKKDFYLMVTAFAPNKRVDLAIKAFNQNGRHLKIIGSGSNAETEILRKTAGSNIEFLGNLSRQEVITYLYEAKALIFPGVEDFGIVPLEALAAGTPVIAYKAGGVLETLTDKTAVYFEEASSDSLNTALREFENSVFNKEELISRANQFSKEQFLLNIKNAVSITLEKNNG